MHSGYQTNYQSFWRFCLCSHQMKDVYLAIGVTLAIIGIIFLAIIAWFTLPTVATVLTWFYWRENTNLFDGHFSAGGVITNLIIWSAAQAAAIIVLVAVGFGLGWLGFGLYKLDECIKGCIDDIREDYKKEMDQMP